MSAKTKLIYFAARRWCSISVSYTHLDVYKRQAIVTARNAPAHERVITTLEHWGVSANETFFLGGMKKDRILTRLKPHMFFDDQKSHLESEAGDIPMVHIPFGIANTIIDQGAPEGRSAG